MADNVPVTPGTGVSVAADDVGGVLYQRVKIGIGADGSAADLTFGQSTKSGSLPVTLASDDDLQAKLGIVTETAPASDTASSGLNGRLQRIAQNITTLSAKFGSLGQAAKAGSVSVTVASDDDLQGKLGALTESAPGTDTASSGLNGRLQRIAQNISSLSAKIPGTLGGKTAANSLSITTATDDPTLAVYGAVTETAPASDTATSGLNGRLQRIAQNITGMSAKIPATLGTKTAANSMAVSIASDDTILSQLGSTSETAPASDTATSGLNGRLQRVAQRLSSLIGLIPVALGQGTMAQSFRVVVASDQSTLPINQVSSAYDVAATVTRPANTTAYSSYDVVGGAITFTTVGPSGGSVMITGVEMWQYLSAIPSGQTGFGLHLYNVTPPSAIADNTAFTLPSGDRASHLGWIDLGVPIAYGGTTYCSVENINKQIRLSSANLFGYLVTNAGYTPAANSEQYVIRLHTIAV